MKLLIVDDDTRFSESLKQALSSDYEVYACSHPKEIPTLTSKNMIDLLLCDFDFGCDNILNYIGARTRQVPLIVMTGKATRDNIIELLNIGVEGLIEKPINLSQLKSKIHKLLLGNKELQKSVLAEMRLLLNENERIVEYENRKEKLTPIEMKILLLLIKNFNKKVTREEIEKHIWPEVVVSKHTLDTHIGNLKKKAPPMEKHLFALYGEGFLLKVKNENA